MIVSSHIDPWIILFAAAMFGVQITLCLIPSLKTIHRMIPLILLGALTAISCGLMLVFLNSMTVLLPLVMLVFIAYAAVCVATAWLIYGIVRAVQRKKRKSESHCKPQ